MIHMCQKCMKMFEGDVCPECGTRYEPDKDPFHRVAKAYRKTEKHFDDMAKQLGNNASRE